MHNVSQIGNHGSLGHNLDIADHNKHKYLVLQVFSNNFIDTYGETKQMTDETL
ncbi:hypothetical protein OQJ65_21755 [Vibrio sp. Sgm 22]|uniref:hypothetical protein n=1 Tax=unclassified Vibrio TaxID=2614977 RepID=UPI002248F362|nr:MULTISPECIES: hypothetical protein [unclassified Vibrio]MCX2761018.1 hypothetical protein [Vibrio sp. 14G-20]MCX2777939.1 hypothetical protein [Vibrio sp. Sgm 22]